MISCGLLTPNDLSSVEHGAEILELFSRRPWILPTHVGNYEPISNSYADIPSGLKYWADPFLWKNKNSKSEGSIWFSRKRSHSCIYASMPQKRNRIDQVEWVDFLKEICRAVKPDFGYLHLVSKLEGDDPDVPYEEKHALGIGPTIQNLKKGIRNVPWAMVLGPQYEGYFQLFLGSTVAKAEQLSEDMLFVQVTPRMTDPLNSYLMFKESRNEIASKLGEHGLKFRS